MSGQAITGKSNYTWFAASIETSLEETIQFLETYEGAVQSACWFWENNNLNDLADKLDVKLMTKKINGGYIGLDDRIKHINHAVHVLSGH
jgi:putative chitinase